MLVVLTRIYDAAIGWLHLSTEVRCGSEELVGPAAIYVAVDTL